MGETAHGCRGGSGLRVFVTGASGFIGAAAARALQRRGHSVFGLARSPATAARLRAAGVNVVPGDLADDDELARGAASADAVIHAGFARNAFDGMQEAVALEQRATTTLLDATSRTASRLVYTSGIGVVGETGRQAVTEDDPVEPPPTMRWRRDLELEVLAAGHGIVIRPAFVYGRGGGEILRTLIEYAVERGESLYPGDGDNCWPNVHVDDLGEAYALAVARPRTGTVLNVAGGEASLRSVGGAIGRLIGGPERTSSVPVADALGTLPFAEWLGRTSIHIDPSRARRLGWHPAGPDIHWDIEFGSYRQLLGEQPRQPTERA